MTEWQDISTAPKDGTVVICAWPGFGSVPKMHVGECVYKSDWYPLGRKQVECWWTKSGGPTAQGPTHWQPLPDPPSA